MRKKAMGGELTIGKSDRVTVNHKKKRWGESSP